MQFWEFFFWTEISLSQSKIEWLADKEMFVGMVEGMQGYITHNILILFVS